MFRVAGLTLLGADFFMTSAAILQISYSPWVVALILPISVTTMVLTRTLLSLLRPQYFWSEPGA